MAWKVATLANLIIALAYFAICLAILRPLAQTGQLRQNRLGVATAAIFFTCAVHHGAHSVHMLLPTVGIEEHTGLDLRNAFAWHMVLWDVLGAVVAIYYWTLRSTYGALMQGAKLFEDMKERQRQALEINDTIVQGLTAASIALSLDEKEQSHELLEATLTSARQIINELLGEAETPVRLSAGDLVRERPAQVIPRGDEGGR